MRESIPQAQNSRDVYLFMAVFHGMPDQTVSLVLKHLKEQMMKSGATAVIVDAVAQECNIDPNIASFDMQMLVGTQGRERTINEWRKVVSSAGLHIDQVIDARAFAKYIVLVPGPGDDL